MGKKPRQWTKEEETYIIKHYGKISAKIIAEKLNIKVQQILLRAKHLGLKSDLNNYKLRNKQQQNILKIKAKGFEFIDEYTNLREKIRFKCRCGTIFQTQPYSLISGCVTSCGCNKGWALRRGTDVIGLTYFNNLKNKAKERKLEFDITIEYLSNLLKKQNFKCALSGIEIECGYKSGSSASVDRIKNNIGYIEGNVQWVHKDINIMKHAIEQTKFIEYCHKISKLNMVKNES